MNVALLTILLNAIAAEPVRSGSEVANLAGCVVSLHDEVLVPAPHAGVLLTMSVREGSRLKLGQAIAHIDDSQQRLELELARNEREAAHEKSTDDTNVRHAEAARLVSEAELHGALAVNKKVAGTHSTNEIRRLTLAARKMALLVERSQAEQRVAGIELRGREVALALAQQQLHRCAIEAPLAGEVIEVFKNAGEWVNPGEPVVHVVRLDKLRVEGFVNASEHSPAAVDARPVRVTVAVEHGRKVEFAGRIVYVRPTVQAGEQYLVYADVENRSENGHWLLRPGMIAEMQIDTSAGRRRHLQRAPPMSTASTCSQNLVVRRRADLITSVQWQRGQRVYVVKDPLALKYFRFSEIEQAILQQLDRPTSPQAIALRLAQEFPESFPAVDEVKAFIASLYHHGLVVSDGPEQGRRLLERKQSQRRQQRRRLATNLLSIRTPGIDPTRLLNAIYPWTGWFFGRWAIVGVALLALAALAIVAMNAARVPNELVAMHSYFGNGNWLLLALTFAITKMLHELGHALACRRCGGECHEIGVMFLVLTPCLYCDVSDSWMLPSKWRRAAIAAAGMYVEVMLASAATLLWSQSEAGTLHYLALQVMLVCGVSTVLFNGNPLARYDGYHILADLVEIPNLRDVARASFTAHLWSLIGIVRRGAPTNPPWGLVGFGLAVKVYRWLLLTAILGGLHMIMAARGLEVAWQVLFVSVLFSVVILPTVGLLRALARNEVIETMNHRRLLFVASGLLSTAIVVFAIPLPHRVHGTFETRYAGGVQLYAPHPATLERLLVPPGQAVRQGQTIAELKSIDLELELAQLRAEVAQHQRDLATLQYERFRDPRAIEAVGQAEELLAAAHEKLAERIADLAKLQILAPRSGVVLPPPRRSGVMGQATLAAWVGTPFDARNERAPLAQGDVVCEVGDPTQLEAHLIADQADVELLRVGQAVELVLDAEPLRILRGEIAEISLDKLVATPEGMSVQAGGQVPSRIDSAGVDRPANSSYTVVVPLTAADIPHAAGLRVGARRYWA